MTDRPRRLSAWLRAHDSLWRYVLVGGFNSLLDLGLFTLFAIPLGLQPLVANVLSTTITLCVSYLINRFWVFRSDANWARSAVSFVVVTLTSGLVIQSGVIWLVLRAAEALAPGLSYAVVAPVAKVLAMGVGMITNYLGYRWLFGERSGETRR